MKRVVAVPATHKERERVLEVLLDYLKNGGKDDEGLIHDFAEVLIRARHPSEFDWKGLL